MWLNNIRKSLMDTVRDWLGEYPEIKPSVIDHLVDLVDDAFQAAWDAGWRAGAGYEPTCEWRTSASLEDAYCSRCGYHVAHERRSKYCPNCGGRTR